MSTTMASIQHPSLDDWLPDSVVLQDLRAIVISSGGGKIELDSGLITISPDTNCVVVAKSWREVRLDIGLGNCFRVLVAIGGVKSVDAGVVTAVHCFCTLWYTSRRELITTDFSSVMPG